MTRQRGMAVLLVLGVTTILAGLAADFAFQSRVAIRLADAEVRRLQAEYLARSAINFLRLELVQEKQLKSVIQKLSNGSINPKVPLCKQFPLSTELLRGFFGVSATGVAEDDAAAAQDDGQKKGGDSEVITSFDTAEAAKFLRFTGNFSAACEDESAKLNLNVFANLKPEDATIGGLNAYDRQKVTLTNFLMTPGVRTLFGEETEAPQLIAEAVRNIADWVDANDQVNQAPGVAGGSERDPYRDRDSTFKMRNGKMLTVDEAYVIAGVSDEWFTPLRKYLTVYGGSKINICTAEPPVVESLLVSYAANNARIPDIAPDNRETLDAAVDAVAMECTGLSPSVGSITQAVEAVLMGGVGLAGATEPPASAGATAGGGLAELITVDAGTLRLIGTGTVPTLGGREISVTIEAVLDTKETDPKKWKMMYWNEE